LFLPLFFIRFVLRLVSQITAYEFVHD